jgi:hypothetical protein
LSVGRIETAAAHAERVNVAVTWQGSAATFNFHAQALGALGAPGIRAVRAVCLDAVWDPASVSCRDGSFSYDDAVLGRGRGALGLDAGSDAAALTVQDLGIGGGRGSARLELGAGVPRLEARARGFDLRWLERAYAGIAGRALPYTGLGGVADLEISARWPDTGRLVVDFRDLAFTGPSSGEQLSGAVEAEFTRGPDRTDFKLAASLRSGIAYLEPGFELRGMRAGFTIEAPPTPLGVSVEGTWRPAARRLKMQSTLKHDGVVDLEFKTVATLGEPVTIERATLDLHEAALGPFYETYLRPVLLGTQYANLEIVGRATGRVRVDAARLQRMALRLHDLHAYDDRGRFHVAGLDGALIVTDSDTTQFSALRWQELGVYRLRFGAGALMFESAAGRLDLVGAGAIPFLDGALRIDELGVAYTGRIPRPALTLSGTLDPVSLAAFTESLGWPIMQGQLGGRISKLRYRHGRVRLDGELAIDGFDGRVVMRNLRARGLFERVPRAYADIDVENLDLAGLTQTFSFGRIDGRLSGRLHKLELAAWRPVYFEAEFATPPGDGSAHRISRRAVDDLTQLAAGTAGAATGPMSSGVLRFFQSYSYDRLGIRCRLYNGTCELAGVADTEDGFYILTRGGVMPPWIDIKARGRSMPWSMLVGGLRAIRDREAVVEVGGGTQREH